MCTFQIPSLASPSLSSTAWGTGLSFWSVAGDVSTLLLLILLPLQCVAHALSGSLLLPLRICSLLLPCCCEPWILGGPPLPGYGHDSHSSFDPQDCLADAAGVYFTWLQLNCPEPLPYIAKRFPNRYATWWFRQLFTYSPTSLVLWNTARGHIFLF